MMRGAPPHGVLIVVLRHLPSLGAIAPLDRAIQYSRGGSA
jgi:hypothetical protein